MAHKLINGIIILKTVDGGVCDGQGFEHLYWGYIRNSTNLMYNLNPEKPPKVYGYKECVEVDSQFFYSGVPWDMTARNYSALTINMAFNTSLTSLDVIAVYEPPCSYFSMSLIFFLKFQ